jgi:hypothetical protein
MCLGAAAEPPSEGRPGGGVAEPFAVTRIFARYLGKIRTERATALKVVNAARQ